MQNLTISLTGALLMGAGIQLLPAEFSHGLILVGLGAVMQIIVAVLNKYGVPVSFGRPEDK